MVFEVSNDRILAVNMMGVSLSCTLIGGKWIERTFSKEVKDYQESREYYFKCFTLLEDDYMTTGPTNCKDKYFVVDFNAFNASMNLKVRNIHPNP